MIRPATTAQNADAAFGGRSLALELMRASKAATSKFFLLRALAGLDPQRAALWLHRTGNLVQQFITDSEAVKVVDDLAHAAHRTRDMETAHLLAEFLSTFPQYASRGAMQRLVDVMEPGKADSLLTPAFDRLLVQQTYGADVVNEVAL